MLLERKFFIPNVTGKTVKIRPMECVISCAKLRLKIALPLNSHARIGSKCNCLFRKTLNADSCSIFILSVLIKTVPEKLDMAF